MFPKPVKQKKVKKKKPPSRTKLKGKADSLFSQFIRKRDKQCLRCGSFERLQCAHIVSRGYLSIRWDPTNAIALCAGCHVYFTHHPIEWENWIDEKFGEEYYRVLKREALKKHDLDYERTLVLVTELLTKLN